jgi:hypothetical protein
MFYGKNMQSEKIHQSIKFTYRVSVGPYKLPLKNSHVPWRCSSSAGNDVTSPPFSIDGISQIDTMKMEMALFVYCSD